MPRQLRIEYPGAVYHDMSRGDRREDISLDDVDRQDFLKTLAERCLLAYPWSSLPLYLAAPEHRPRWLRGDRLLGEHGIPQDTVAGRQVFERQMEQRRLEETDPQSLCRLRRGWFLGGEQFRQELLQRRDGRLGDHHSGALRLERAQAKAERIIAEEPDRRGWKEFDLAGRHKSDPAKLATF